MLDRTTSSEPPSWLPDFCRVPVILVLMVATQLVVTAIALAPQADGGWSAGDFLRASAFAQWMALASVVVLCVSRAWIAGLPPLAGTLLAWAIPVAVTTAGAVLTWHVNAGVGADFGFAAVDAGIGFTDFVLGCSVLAAMMSAVALRYFYIQERWQQQVRAQAKAQVEALQARIRPHFLFNSMNTIASLIREDPETAERAVEDLSDLFRAALGAGEGESTLAEELALVRQYVAIEALRLGPRLRLRWELDDDLPGELVLPRLLLQPLVENAIVHGVALLESGGEVHISGEVVDGRLHLAVRNPTASGRQRRVNGHAQDSIIARLRYHYGPRARMKCTAEDGSYLCELEIPLR